MGFGEVGDIAERFRTGGSAVEVVPLGGGHIHATFRVTVAGGRRFVVQRINRAIFPRPAEVMENVCRVSEHLRARGVPSLEVVSTCDGEPYLEDDRGDCWRVFRFIAGAAAAGSLSSPRRAEAVARAFGEFGRHLAGLPPPRLHEVIPGFHDTPRRLDDLDAAAHAAPRGASGEVRAELEFVCERRGVAAEIERALRGGRIPLRVAHNDAKVANVLFETGGAGRVWVIDLDTAMPGTPLHDFGDLVRSAAATAPECEADLSRVGFSVGRFEALARGFAAGAGELLTDDERGLMARAAQVITLEQAARFLADHLRGDRYYPVAHRGENLDRARNQIRLLRAMEARAGELAEICSRL